MATCAACGADNRESALVSTDYLDLHSDALLALAEVLEVSGAGEETAARLREALQLVERREDVVQAKQTREPLRTKAAV